MIVIVIIVLVIVIVIVIVTVTVIVIAIVTVIVRVIIIIAAGASGSRQFRAGIVFLEFLAAENLKNTIPAPSAVACRRRSNSNSNSKSNNSISNRNSNSNNSHSNSNSNSVSHNPTSSSNIGVPPTPSAGIVFLEFLAAENLKNTIPAPLFRGMGHRVTEHRVPYQTGSGNRVFRVFSCRKPQKHDSRPALWWGVGGGPQNLDSGGFSGGGPRITIPGGETANDTLED